MRPVRLELEGFTSFRQPCRIDFAELDLFAITGPTGSGKTSLIDSILFALYGRTPRIGQTTGDLISQGGSEMKVLLEFRAGGQLYRAFRQVKRKGSGKQRLDRNSGGEWETLADKSTAMDRTVQQILGLDFDGFTKTVVLPQGEFDRFLRGEAKKRRAILIELLGLDIYARMMRKANEDGAKLTDRAKLLEDHVNRQLAGLSPERIADWETELATAREQEMEVRANVERIDEAFPLQMRIKELLALAQQRQRLTQELAPLEGKLAESKAALETLDAQMREAREVSGDVSSPELLRRKAQEIRKAVKRKAEIATHRVLLERLKKEAAELAPLVLAGAASHEAAKAAVVEAIQSNAADQLREHIHAGDECPVCEQIVLLVPPPKSNSTVAGAQAAEKRIAREYDDLRRKEAEKASNLKATHQQIKSWENDLVDVEGDPDVLEAEAARTESARLELRTLELRLEASRKTFEADRDRASAGIAKLQVIEERLAGEEDVDALQAQLGPLAERDLEGERKQLNAALQALHRGIASKEAEIAHASKTLAESEEKRAEIRELSRSSELARKLGTMLQENRFQTFVLSQTLHRLAVEGTRQLMHLSSGRYGFATEGDEFLVVDHWNADEKRSVNTLSGGESFLASLSLALALSRSLPDFAVNRDAIQLDSLFLDEGFSTLDNETMQIVLDAIELLQADGRMIGVVSHVTELAERLPRRIEVSKSPGGSTVTVK